MKRFIAIPQVEDVHTAPRHHAHTLWGQCYRSRLAERPQPRAYSRDDRSDVSLIRDEGSSLSARCIAPTHETVLPGPTSARPRQFQNTVHLRPFWSAPEFPSFFFYTAWRISLDTGQGTSTVLAVSTDGIVACRRYSTTVSAYRVVQGQPRWLPISSVFRSKALIGVP